MHQWTCHTDAANYKQIIEKEQAYKFLLGLRDKFEDVRERITRMKLFPSLEETMNMVKCEESRKELIQCIPPQATESSAMVSKSSQPSDFKGKKSSKWCNHCNKARHTRATCWKIHGKPPNQGQRTKPESKGLSMGTETENVVDRKFGRIYITRK